MVLEVEEDVPEVVEEEAGFEVEELVDARSLKRLVLPRWAPRLVAPVPVELAVLVVTGALGSEVPPAVEEEEEAPLDKVEVPEEEADEELEEPELEPLLLPPPPPLPPPPLFPPPPPIPPRPRPLRLPRSCGAMRAAKRSALTDPESRIVRSTSPTVTVAVAI
jgi:hypothetical protein